MEKTKCMPGFRKCNEKELSEGITKIDISNMTEEQKKKVIEDAWQHILKKDQN